MGQTPIQWADHSINPFRARNLKTGKVGHFCAKVSAGCKNCYSSKLQSPHLVGLPFLAENRPKVELYFEEKAIQEVMRRKKPTKYFWSDMTDMFWEEYPDEWIDRCFAVMALSKWHTHLVLTKRSGRMRKYISSVSGPLITAGVDWPPPNVWLGVSCEDQATANERIPELLKTPAAIRFVSYEPALESVDFTPYLWGKAIEPLIHGCADCPKDADCECGWKTRKDNGESHISWIITGGESGPGARPFDLDWARDTIKQCAAASTACFVKQIGAKPYQGGSDPATRRTFYPISDKKGGLMADWPADIRVRQFPGVRWESKAHALNDGDNPRPSSQVPR